MRITMYCTLLPNLQVPSDSGLVQSIRQRGEADQKEKNEMKKLTLGITKRMEEEDRLEG